MLKWLLAAILYGASAAPALAQDEIVVTASRRSGSDAADVAGIGVKRRADFAVQRVTVYGDTRDKVARRAEILATVKAAIDAGQKRGVALAYGESVIRPLTLANYATKLVFTEDEDRDDAEQVSFIIKTPLKDGDAFAALDRLSAFVKAVPLNGRALIEAEGEAGVSIVDPGQYRAQVIAAIAADATAAAKLFGEDFGAHVSNLAQPVRWVLTGPTEVLLYIPHDLQVMPKD
ncbi:MAG: TonB-dependent receptor [Sphingomonas sp.]|nr:TonB-dependent receptor [Sphingomonas sp.]